MCPTTIESGESHIVPEGIYQNAKTCQAVHKVGFRILYGFISTTTSKYSAKGKKTISKSTILKTNSNLVASPSELI